MSAQVLHYFTFVVWTPSRVISRAERHAYDGSICIPTYGTDFRFDAAIFSVAVGESEREWLNERIGGEFFFPVWHPMVEGADGGVVSQKSRHFRLLFAKKLDQTYVELW